jgi:uncharacterized protein YndB with AHSA1/START domain
MKKESFIIEKIFNVPVANVWKAITNKDEMKHWYFDLVEFKPEVGFQFSFIGRGKDGTKEYIHRCEIKEVIPEKKLMYSWRYEGFEGNSFVTFELFAEGNKTKLKLTHEGLETFPTNNSDFAKENFVEGWTYIIGRSLQGYIETSAS